MSAEWELKTPIVEVEWTDASGKSRWGQLEEYLAHHPHPCRTAGYLIRRTKEEILIALTQSEDGQLNGAIAIPIQWVKKIKILRK